MSDITTAVGLTGATMVDDVIVTVGGKTVVLGVYGILRFYIPESDAAYYKDCVGRTRLARFVIVADADDEGILSGQRPLL
jgi:hypothetical protein